jgi:hypothetical protein
LFDQEPFLRPDHDPAEAPSRSRGQGWPSLRASASDSFGRPRLDGGEHGARLDGRDEAGSRARAEWRDVILDWAVKSECGRHRITLYPVGCENPVP